MNRMLPLCVALLLTLTGCGSHHTTSTPSILATTTKQTSSVLPTIPTTPAPMPTASSAALYALVTFSPELALDGATYTGLPALPLMEHPVSDPDNLRGLSQTRIDFSFGAACDGLPHAQTVRNQQQFDAWGTGALAWDNISQEKVLYLTFDCGYAYEDVTELVLDVLAEKQVRTTFFCTMSYLRNAPQEVRRMLAEGHSVGNHSLSHPADPAALSREQMVLEALAVENYLRVNFGYSAKYFRFPSGIYSENALQAIAEMGYRSVFWSIAYADWDPENQQGAEVALRTLTQRLHPGAVILLHTTSRDNAQILGQFIDYAISQGYAFRTLEEYPGWES